MMASLQHLSEARHDILRSFSLYSDLKSPYLKHRTLRDVYLPTKKSVLRHLGDKEVRAYTSIDCLRYLQAMISNQKPKGINIRIRTLRAFGAWASSHEILPA